MAKVFPTSKAVQYARRSNTRCTQAEISTRVRIGRGDKIRTCDPLHPMDSMAKRDETLCHALNRVIIHKIPYFLGFSTLFALRVVS
jgi:hypothetical protein